VQAGWQAASRLQLALRWQMKGLGVARSRGRAAMHLGNQRVAVRMVSPELKFAGPLAGVWLVRGHARQRVKPSLMKLKIASESSM
jgi:hypothetical protein